MKKWISDALKTDWRNIANGLPVVKDGYADQPYLIKAEDGAWLCCVTVSSGHEGNPDQHVQTMRSTDQGHSWETPVRIEESGQPENSYAVMLKTSGKRIYIFYNFNADRVKKVLCHDGKNSFSRVDSLGHYVFRYSDDNGRSWSSRRYEVPVREFQCDRDNIYGGSLRFFWNVGKPCMLDGAAFLTLHKVGEMGSGFFQKSEGVLLRCDNINSENDPEKLHWETLPEGDIGLLPPHGYGKIAEEQNCVVLSDKSICCSYRSVGGYGIEAYSRDNGKTFSAPDFKRRYDGRKLKNPRACNTVWNYTPGKYLYWFHNHGGHFIQDMAAEESLKNHNSPYSDRNPVWICGGTEVSTPHGLELRWSEPQILFYDVDRDTRMSYPDFLMDGDRCFFTETEKVIARVHEVPKTFLDGLFLPEKLNLLATSKEKEIDFTTIVQPHEIIMPGFYYSIVMELNDFSPDILCRSMDRSGTGFEITLTQEQRILFRWSDPQQTVMAESETLSQYTRTVEIRLDITAAVIIFYADGKFCDGGEEKQFGWQRLSRDMTNLFSGGKGILGESVKSISVYEK